MIGRLSRGLDDASANGWHIVSMKNDFTGSSPRNKYVNSS